MFQPLDIITSIILCTFNVFLHVQFFNQYIKIRGLLVTLLQYSVIQWIWRSQHRLIFYRVYEWKLGDTRGAQQLSTFLTTTFKLAGKLVLKRDSLYSELDTAIGKPSRRWHDTCYYASDPVDARNWTKINLIATDWRIRVIERIA